MNQQDKKNALKQRVEALTGDPYVSALTAAGVNIFNTEMIPPQALTAAALRKGPASAVTADFGIEVGPGFSEAVSVWLAGSDHSPSSWNALLDRELQGPMEGLLQGQFAAGMKRRGLRPADAEAVTNSVRKALLNAGDIRKRLLNPERTRANETPTHQIEVVRSLARSAEDQYLKASVAKDPNLTGRRRWVAPSGADSRHAHLNGVVVEKGQSFDIAGQPWNGPRSRPHQVKDSSNCTCYLQWEFADGTWSGDPGISVPSAPTPAGDKKALTGPVHEFSGDNFFLSGRSPHGVSYQGQDYATLEEALSVIRTKPEWEAHRVEIVDNLVTQKVNKYQSVKTALLKTGDRELIYSPQLNPNRYKEFYPTDKTLGVDSKGKGENLLGKSLMKVRNYFQKNDEMVRLLEEERKAEVRRAKRTAQQKARRQK